MISCYWFNGWTNAGDVFTPYLLRQMGVEYEFNNEHPNFVATGSILTVPFINNDTKIWGSGFIKATNDISHINTSNVYAVRGKLSKNILKCENCAVGDPGLLASKVSTLPHITKQWKYGVIPHMIDKPFLGELEYPNNTHIIDICTDDFIHLFEEILSCGFIISSSLHGIIFAHSFGIPAFHIICNETVPTIDDFKFKDYYSIWSIPYFTKRVLTVEDLKFAEFDLMSRHSELFCPSSAELNTICDSLMMVFPFPKE